MISGILFDFVIDITVIQNQQKRRFTVTVKILAQEKTYNNTKESVI